MMNLKNILAGLITLILLLLVLLSFLPKKNIPTPGAIIFTAIPATNDFDNTRFPEQSIIFQINALDNEPIQLTHGFYSARSPEVSFDGSKMLFSAQKNKDERWQIWEMDRHTSTFKQITTRSFNCTDPAYIPNGSIVFSSTSLRLSNVDGVMALFTIKTDGTGETQITFHPNDDQSPTVLRDGRILINTRQVYPGQGPSIQLVLRPDGTKGELFYKPNPESDLRSRGWETEDGYFVYVESQGNGPGRIMSINTSRPLYSQIDLSADYSGAFYSVFPSKNNEYLVSYQTDPEKNFGLYRMKPGSESPMELIYANKDFNLIEPVSSIIRTKPKNLPSRIVEGDENGTILCLDANLSQDSVVSGIQSSKTFTVEVLGVNETLASVPVSADGSFYIEVPSNLPIRFQTFNEDGQLVRGPSDWIWVRPKERRGCIGCHEDKELTPENRVPLAVKEKPFNLLDYAKNMKAD